jgi:hypothetical protein
MNLIKFMENFTWPVFGQLLGAIIGAVISIITLLNLVFQYKNSSRHKLKMDLEILRHFEKDDNNYLLIKSIVNQEVESIYVRKIVLYRKVEFFLGLLCFIVFIAWASNIYYKNNGITTGFVIVVSYAMNSLFFMLDSFRKQSMMS